MSSTLPVSIFNDLIGPVMRGPSRSQCAAALRIGRLARDPMGGDIPNVLVDFDRNNSLPTTAHDFLAPNQKGFSSQFITDGHVD